MLMSSITISLSPWAQHHKSNKPKMHLWGSYLHLFDLYSCLIKTSCANVFIVSSFPGLLS